MADIENDPIDAFIEQMGLITQAEGAPRIAGRVFGLLLVEEGPMALQEVADRLGVSKASVSTNARMLAQRGLIRLRSRSGDRQDYYELVPDPYRHMLDAIRERMARNADQVTEAALRLPDGMSDAKERIGRLAGFYRASSEAIGIWSERLADDVFNSETAKVSKQGGNA